MANVVVAKISQLIPLRKLGDGEGEGELQEETRVLDRGLIREVKFMYDSGLERGLARSEML